jgi:hypothetical protein
MALSHHKRTKLEAELLRLRNTAAEAQTKIDTKEEESASMLKAAKDTLIQLQAEVALDKQKQKDSMYRVTRDEVKQATARVEEMHAKELEVAKLTVGVETQRQLLLAAKEALNIQTTNLKTKIEEYETRLKDENSKLKKLQESLDTAKTENEQKLHDQDEDARTALEEQQKKHEREIEQLNAVNIQLNEARIKAARSEMEAKLLREAQDKTELMYEKQSKMYQDAAIASRAREKETREDKKQEGQQVSPHPHTSNSYVFLFVPFYV